MYRNYFLIMAAIGLSFPVIANFIEIKLSAIHVLVWLTLFWGIPSYYVHWCMHLRNVGQAPSNILVRVESEWIDNGPFQKRSELNSLQKQQDIRKLKKGLERLLVIQQELIKRGEKNNSKYGLELQRSQEKRTEETRVFLEQIKNLA